MGVLADFVQPDWYLDAFTSTTAELPWTDDTDGEVNRLVEFLDPPEGARILDLACGWGRQALELARRGFSVVGVDVSECLIEIAGGNLELEERRLGRTLNLEYREADLRDLHFAPEFDVVLNLNGGAIGYFENDEQNRRTFAAIGNALRPGGRTLLQIPNPDHLGKILPERVWTLGEKMIEMRDRHWGPKDRYVEGTMIPLHLDDATWLEPLGFRYRVYTPSELNDLLLPYGVCLEAVIDQNGRRVHPPATPEELFVIAQKNRRS